MVYRIFGMNFNSMKQVLFTNIKQMKITALVPEELIEDVKKYSGGRNITESLIIALSDYINRQRIKKSIQKIKKSPLTFINEFSGEQVRKQNRE